jgi:hypothetical protein
MQHIRKNELQVMIYLVFTVTICSRMVLRGNWLIDLLSVDAAARRPAASLTQLVAVTVLNLITAIYTIGSAVAQGFL